jgi:hypothetical protein
LRIVLDARAIPVLIASSKLFSDDDEISVTLATLIILFPFFE